MPLLVPQPTSRSNRGGFSLLELLAVILIAAVVLLAVFYSAQTSTGGAVRDAATAFRMGTQSARVQALTSGEDFILTIDAGGGGEGRGRWITQRVTAGDVAPVPNDSSWMSLLNGATFSVGNATLDVHGNAIGPAVPRVAIACDGGLVCDLGGAASASFYMSHVDDPTVVWAIVITVDGTVTQLSWNPLTTAWE